ncbi:hypothetical protein [Kordiimonas gwangyangensis]|uniref:hypothetical protein n=1 Tax=Kordiimonas gwangyangensis TaxID=288022 RepID=UPI00037B013C|nr:hypothetical protein [Kordiimonas gwangyangensis]
MEYLALILVLTAVPWTARLIAPDHDSGMPFVLAAPIIGTGVFLYLEYLREGHFGAFAIVTFVATFVASCVAVVALEGGLYAARAHWWRLPADQRRHFTGVGAAVLVVGGWIMLEPGISRDIDFRNAIYDGLYQDSVQIAESYLEAQGITIPNTKPKLVEHEDDPLKFTVVYETREGETLAVVVSLRTDEAVTLK